MPIGYNDAINQFAFSIEYICSATSHILRKFRDNKKKAVAWKMRAFKVELACRMRALLSLPFTLDPETMDGIAIFSRLSWSPMKMNNPL